MKMDGGAFFPEHVVDRRRQGYRQESAPDYSDPVYAWSLNCSAINASCDHAYKSVLWPETGEAAGGGASA